MIAAGNGRFGAAAFYATLALLLDADNGAARARLLEVAPDISLAVLPGGAGA